MGLGDVARSLFWGMALLILASAASCSYFALAALKGGEPRVAPKLRPVQRAERPPRPLRNKACGAR